MGKYRQHIECLGTCMDSIVFDLISGGDGDQVKPLWSDWLPENLTWFKMLSQLQSLTSLCKRRCQHIIIINKCRQSIECLGKYRTYRI